MYSNYVHLSNHIQMANNQNYNENLKSKQLLDLEKDNSRALFTKKGKSCPFSVVRITLCTPERDNFSPSFFVHSLQGSTLLSQILLPTLSVSLLHPALTSRPSYLAGKGEELPT